MWWAVLVSLLAPGFGQALARRRGRALAWAGVALVSVVAIVWIVWLYPVALLVRVVAAIEAAVVLRRSQPGAVDRTAAIVLAIGAVGIVYSQLALQSFRIPTSSMYPTIQIGDHLFVDKLTPAWRPIERGELVVHRYPCDPRVTYVKRVVAVGGDTVEVRCDVLYVNGKAVPHTVVAANAQYDDRNDVTGAWTAMNVSRWHDVLDGHAFDVFEGAASHGERDFPRLDAAFAPGCANQAMFRNTPATHEVHGEITAATPGAGACEPQRHYVVPKGALFGLGDNRYNANDSRYWGAFPADDVIGRVIGVWYNDAKGGLGRIGAVH